MITKRDIACTVIGLVLGGCLAALFFSVPPEGSAAKQIRLLQQENAKLRELNEVRKKQFDKLINALEVKE